MSPQTGDLNDFTLDAYRALLPVARRHWRFRRFTDYDPTERFVLWRHDVDVSVADALTLARIEAEAGVVATYYFHLHSEFYNLLERRTVDQAREIAALGHDVGLHFDTHFYDIVREEELEPAMARERALLELTIGTPVRTVSFHNTTPFTQSCRAATYAGMVNAYADYFQREVAYVSDSNGYWRFRRLQDVLAAGEDPRLQVLTHDAWWQPEPMLPADRVRRAIDARAAATWAQYCDVLKRAGRLNVGVDAVAATDGGPGAGA